MTATTLIIAWAIAFAFFVVVEVATTGALVSVWLGIGSLFAMFCAIGETPLWVQLLVFVVSSTVMLIVTRPFVKKFQGSVVQTNFELNIGKTAIVTEDIINEKCEGRVTLDGTNWAAVSADNDLIPAGTSVTVRQVDGAKLIVARS
ncbi:MAG: NfeD family protein [Ruminococcus sp.]|nr:NfeD family protein [Ruminococcus sp.]